MCNAFQMADSKPTLRLHVHYRCIIWSSNPQLCMYFGVAQERETCQIASVGHVLATNIGPANARSFFLFITIT